MIDDAEERGPLMTEAEAARFLRIHPRTLGNIRRRGQGPPHVKLVGKASPALYHRETLEAWFLSQEKRGAGA